MKSKKLIFYVLLLALLIMGFFARKYKIDSPVSDWFSWRQTDTAAVGRFYAKDGIDVMKPRFYDLSSIQSGIENPHGYRMVEFPAYSATFAFLYETFGQVSIETWARIVTSVLSLAALVVIYILLYEETGLFGAFFGSLFFAVFPYVVFYSHTILPDMPATSLAVLSLYFTYRYSRGKSWIHLIFALLLFALGLLVKPMVIFYGFVHLYLIMFASGRRGKKALLALLIFSLSAVPVYLWRNYIQQFPEGIPASSWLLTSVSTSTGMHNIFMRPAFFRWIFYERINNLILGGYVMFFLIYGFFYKTKQTLLHYAFALSALSYLFVFQGGNVQHDYYQIIITPALAMLLGYGVQLFINQRQLGFLVVRVFTVLVLFGASLAFSYYQVKAYYNQNSDWLLIADVIRSVTSPQDTLVLDALGDTTILYLSDRKGYPAPYKELSEFKKQGADYFVTTNSDYKNKFKDSTFSLIFENDKVLVFRL